MTASDEPPSKRPHRCDDECVCPVHGTPLIYWPAGDDHACEDASCIHGHGMDAWGGDLGPFYILEDSIMPLPAMLPSEREARERAYRDSMRALLGSLARIPVCPR